MSEPVFVSMALEELPVPDWADVVVVAVPGDGPLDPDPARWAAAVFDVRSLPRWVRALFALRQGLVGLIGVPRGDATTFRVAEVRGAEALIRSDERHLDFRAAVAVDPDRRLLRVTTAVRLHGLRGRLYFAPVRLLHEPITRSMARSAATRPGPPGA